MKLILELDLPNNATEELLLEQLKQAVRLMKDAIEPYKEKGIKVPTISLRGGLASKPRKMPDDFKEFANELIDLQLKYHPKTDVPPQMATIKRLYEAGFSKEQLISEYEKSYKQWSLTTWFTVASILAKNKTQPEPEGFVRNELDDEAKGALKDRIAKYVGLRKNT